MPLSLLQIESLPLRLTNDKVEKRGRRPQFVCELFGHGLDLLILLNLPRTITMATQAEDDYDKLTPEQRETRDKEDRAREAADQASMSDLSPTMKSHLNYRFIQHCPTLGNKNWVM